jgi:hypothetical protein
MAAAAIILCLLDLGHCCIWVERDHGNSILRMQLAARDRKWILRFLGHVCLMLPWPTKSPLLQNESFLVAPTGRMTPSRRCVLVVEGGNRWTAGRAFLMIGICPAGGGEYVWRGQEAFSRLEYLIVVQKDPAHNGRIGKGVRPGW